MTTQFKSFLSDLENDSGIKASLEQKTTVTPEKLFDWVNQARKLYLTAKLTGQDISSTELSEIQRQLKEIALFLESLFVDEMVDNEKVLASEYDNSFSLIGMIFEYLGDFSTNPVTKLEAYNWYLHASICYSLGNSPANSIVLASKFIDDSQDEQKFTEFEPEKYLVLAKKCILLLLTRSVRKAKKHASELSVWKKERSFRENQSPLLIDTVKGYFELSEFVQYAADYMLTGEVENAEIATNHLEAAIQIFTKGFCSFEAWLGDRLRFIFKQMVARSIWVKLASLNKKRPEYIKALISQHNPITELWPSQIAALEQYSDDGRNLGVLGNAQRHFVISMPTSSGKTRVAEIAIADVIDPSKSDTCIYVVPTRALVNQVANDISVLLEGVGYRVGTAAGSYENIPGLEDALIENVHILITTPEKLDMLDRSNFPAVRQCKLYIFDECHKLEDAGRGLRLEILISRLLQKYRRLGAKFVLLSAVLPRTNLGEFIEWLGSERAIDFVWRPTRLLEGIVYTERGDEITDRKSKRPRREQFYGVEYPTMFELGKLVKGTYFFRYEGKKAEESLNRWDIAAELALIYSKLGSVLIYCPTREEVQNIALRFRQSGYKDKMFNTVSDEVTLRRNALAELIEDRLVKDFPLSEMIKLGVAYHHAYLPADVKKEIELAVKRGDINIISATTTLAEGLNTPVKTVIFADVVNDVSDSENRYKRKLLSQIDPKQFRNISGRAGRALYDTEGHTILLDFHTIYELFNGQKYSLDEFNVVSSFRAVLDRRFEEVIQSGDYQTTLREFYLGSDATGNSPVRSRFFDLIDRVRSLNFESQNEQNDQEGGLLLNETTKKLAEEERFFQSGILALVCEQETIDPNTNLDELTLAIISENGIRSTLFAYQMKDRLDLLQDAIKYTNRQTKFISSRVGKITRQVYNRTGLSLGSCLQLDKFIQDFIQQENANAEQLLLMGWRGTDRHLLLDRIRKFLECVAIPVETRPKELRKIELKTSHEDVLYDWIIGKRIAEIVERNFQAKPRKKQVENVNLTDTYAVMLEATNYIYSHVVTFSSWALGAACTLLKYYAEKMNIQVNPEVWLLPAYTLYGVDSPIACFCVAMGIDDRDVAMALANKYPPNQVTQTYASIPDWGNVKWWFGNINRFALESWLNTKRKVELSWEVIQKAKKKFNLPEVSDYENYLFSCDLRGLMYENRADLIREVYVGYVLRLVREENAFDSNAIRAELEDGRLLGYIPRELAILYAPIMDSGVILYAQIGSITDLDVSIYVFKQ